LDAENIDECGEDYEQTPNSIQLPKAKHGHQVGGNIDGEQRRPQPTPFIGREAELSKIVTQLTVPTCHLLTLGGEAHTLQTASGEIPRFSSLRTATFQLPATQARELKVWVHKVTPEGNSEPLPVGLTVQNDGNEQQFDLQSSGGQVILPYDGEVCQLQVTFE
jgi:hypothetical protein